MFTGGIKTQINRSKTNKFLTTLRIKKKKITNGYWYNECIKTFKKNYYIYENTHFSKCRKNESLIYFS